MIVRIGWHLLLGLGLLAAPAAAQAAKGPLVLAAASLQEQIAQTMRYLKAIPVERFDGPLGRLCRDRAGFADIALPADEYLNLYILPNFYFHFSMAYAIARSQGAAIGKGDFDGYHLYAPDFSFEARGA